MDSPDERGCQFCRSEDSSSGVSPTIFLRTWRSSTAGLSGSNKLASSFGPRSVVLGRPLLGAALPSSVRAQFPSRGQPSKSDAAWGYDPFGNRTLQAGSSASFTAGSATCTPASGASYSSSWARFDTNNQLAATNRAPAGQGYDAAGDTLYDGVNSYLYDAEGRICAVNSTPVPGLTTMTGYVYDADGTRVAKGKTSRN